MACLLKFLLVVSRLTKPLIHSPQQKPLPQRILTIHPKLIHARKIDFTKSPRHYRPEIVNYMHHLNAYLQRGTHYTCNGRSARNR